MRIFTPLLLIGLVLSSSAAADFNGDGLVDVVTSNKKGVYYFEQVRK